MAEALISYEIVVATFLSLTGLLFDVRRSTQIQQVKINKEFRISKTKYRLDENQKTRKPENQKLIRFLNILYEDTLPF